MWVSAASWPPGNTGDRWIPVDQTTKGARHEQKRRKPGRRRQARRRKAWRRQARRRTSGRESAKCPQQEREPVGRRARQQSTALAVIERRSGSVDRGTASPSSCRLSIRVVSPCLRGAWCGCNGCLRREMGEQLLTSATKPVALGGDRLPESGRAGDGRPHPGRPIDMAQVSCVDVEVFDVMRHSVTQVRRGPDRRV